MGETFGDMLDRFHDLRTATYRSDPDRAEVMAREMERIMQTLLEKLRDLHDRR